MVEATSLESWFTSEVLPLEAALLRFLRRNCPQGEDPHDLRQDVFVRVYEAAEQVRPLHTTAFVFTTARNLLIDRARRSKVVSLDAVAEIEAVALQPDEMTPERLTSGRDELRILQQALDSLPSRCREVVALRRIEGLSQREVAERMGITEDTVERQISKGMRAMAAILLDHGVSLNTSAFADAAGSATQDSSRPKSV